MDVKGKVLLQFFNKSKLRNGTKNFSRAKKFGFSAPLYPFILLSLARPEI